MDRKRSAEATATATTTKKMKGGRVVVDVGGQQFVTSRTTLIAGSTYFSLLFSESWTREGDENDVFLDQNPTAFGVLLDYMREGMVQVNDLADVKVLALAEYLGMDKLILAIKVATYVNLHPFFSGTEDEAQQAFDTAYGGSLKSAITSGLLPKALQGQPEGRGIDYAVMNMGALEAQDPMSVMITAPELKSAPEQENFNILGALNWLHYHGYATLEKNMQTTERYGDEKTFSRPSNVFIEFPCTHVLIGWNRRNPPIRKTFALYLSSSENETSEDYRLFYAPRGGREVPETADDDDDEYDTVLGFNSRWCTLAEERCSLKFLQANNYVCREEALEAEFKNDVHGSAESIFNGIPYLVDKLYFQIYSRILDEEEGGALS